MKDEIILYQANESSTRIEVRIYNDTVWLNIEEISYLFDRDRTVINRHINNIFKEEELNKEVVCAFFAHTTQHGAIEGKTQEKEVKFYNLRAIVAVGYRINSHRAIEFRKWATDILHEYIIKGFAMDDERLKQIKHFGVDYFDEMLERIREIRLSERRLYQKITDIYAQCSSDYDACSEITKEFYATVQNKLHYAITGLTAAEIINQRAKSKEPNMGLTSWKNSPNGAIRKSDVTVAKNYLSADELDMYNRIVEMYLNFAEFQAKSKKIMTQKDWIEKLHGFLTMNDRDILQDKGKITAKFAESLAISEFEKYKTEQDKLYVSDFDKLVQKVEKKS